MTNHDTGQFVRNLLRKKDKTEACGWLEGSEKRNVGELSHRASRILIRKLYEFGALEIVAVDISSNAGFESTDTLIATLPSDPVSRKKIFEWNDKRVREMGYESDPDKGQDHLLIWFD